MTILVVAVVMFLAGLALGLRGGKWWGFRQLANANRKQWHRATGKSGSGSS